MSNVPAEFRYPNGDSDSTPDGCWDTTSSPVGPGGATGAPCVCADGILPSPVTVLGPTGDALLAGPLIWEASESIPAGCLGYHVHVRLATNDPCDPDWQGEGTGIVDSDCFIVESDSTIFFPQGLQPGTRYLWRVRASCARNEGEVAVQTLWSDWHGFITPG